MSTKHHKKWKINLSKHAHNKCLSVIHKLHAANDGRAIAHGLQFRKERIAGKVISKKYQ